MLTSDILSNILGKNTLKESMGKDLDQLDFINRQMTFNDVPVEAREGEWTEVNFDNYTAIQKTYIMKNNDHLIYFLNEIIKESNRINHHPKIVIDHLKIDIEIYTKDYNNVTESDVALSKIINEIYNDIFFIG